MALVFATFATEKDVRVRVHLRQAENHVLNDPAIQAEWDAAHRAPSQPERRTLLTAYYNHLYGDMIKLDPSIATLASVRRQAAIERMRYNRLGELDNSEDPFVSPTPEPSGPNPPVPDTTPTP